jgi:hypothetical protein
MPKLAGKVKTQSRLMTNKTNAIPTTAIRGPEVLNLCDKAVSNNTVTRKTVTFYVAVGEKKGDQV